jgi:hypothetical protein
MTVYVLKAVTPDGRKVKWRSRSKKPLEKTRKAALEIGYLRATIKKERKNEH